VLLSLLLEGLLQDRRPLLIRVGAPARGRGRIGGPLSVRARGVLAPDGRGRPHSAFADAADSAAGLLNWHPWMPPALLMDATLLLSVHLLPIALLWCPCLVIRSLSQALYYDGTKSSYLCIPSVLFITPQIL
jgi:hypothetical protein